MLDQMRSFASTWVAKILIGLLIIGLAGFGISNVFLNLGSSTVARVGDEEISSRDFQRAYVNQINAYAQQTGQYLTAEEATQQGIPGAILQRLATDASLDALAKRYGMSVTDERVTDIIANDPSFSDTLGGFNRDAFTEVLRRAGYTENEFIEVQRAAATRQQLVNGLFAGIPAPETMSTLTRRYQQDTRTLNYFIVNSTMIDEIAEPTEEELAAYLEENQAQFRTLETRTVQMLVLTPETLAATIEPTDEQIAAEYDRSGADFQAPEKRAVRTVTLIDEGAMQRFVEGQSEGTDFDTLVSELGLSATVADLGTVSAAEIGSDLVAEAAFETEAGSFALIDGDTEGTAVAVAVDSVEAGGQLPLDDVRDEIADRAALRLANDRMLDIVDQIEELRAGIIPVTQAAEQFNLNLDEVTVNRSGAGLSDVAALPEGASGRLIPAIFNAEQDGLIPSVALSADETVWFDITNIEPARDLTLDEARDDITAALIEERTDKALEAKAEEFVAEMEEGQSLSQVASANGLFPQLSAPVTRFGGDENIGRQVANASFDGGIGYPGYARNAGGDLLVFQVADIQPASEEQTADTLTDAVQTAVLNSLSTAFLQGLQADAGFRVNQGALNQAMELTTSGGQ
ncbi:peptidylprolyl isomerase [Cucumibacter marinus]|uniref:peptidylprolyl isomerase n=1 Tax=Cucumibacter marinus TaxID=1121252 RepID=UPI0003F7211B|nr:peptidylprolyl isomerase [Cucumibacter marinus]